MLRNIFWQSVSETPNKEASTQCELDATQTNILWTQTENIFALIETNVKKFLNSNFEAENPILLEERLDFFYQLLGTVIVEKNSDQFKRKIEIDCKLAECRFKLEKNKKLGKLKTEKTLEEELIDCYSLFEDLKKSNVEISMENADMMKKIRNVLNALLPETPTNHVDRRLSVGFMMKQSETSLLNKLKNLQVFWATVFPNIQPNLTKEIRENVQNILQTLNVEIVMKLRDLHTEDDDNRVSLNSFCFSDNISEFAEDDDEIEPFKDPDRMHTFETIQIARKTVRLKNRVSKLLEEILNNYEDSKYEKMRKRLDKCQDGFEEIESHYHPDLVALRTETFNMLLQASRKMNEIYEERLFRSHNKRKAK